MSRYKTIMRGAVSGKPARQARTNRHSSEDESDAEFSDGEVPDQPEEIDFKAVAAQRGVRAAMEELLDSDLDFSGPFSFKSTYTDAPNPFLNLNGYGRIGLPVNPREMKSIISVCKQAPFGKGDKTIVDKAVRDTWEMDASDFRLDNPEWETYMDRAVKEVCETLGVDSKASQPRAELYKLLVYETGSHFLPHQDTEKIPGMFATIVVVLPSAYTGGAAHLSHGGLSSILDCSTNSEFQTSILAWYTDVTHEIKPITSGYRLALSYNLVHTTNALRPPLPSSHIAVNALRHILESWKQRPDATPLKIVVLLEHQYSQANLRGSALKGRDAHTAGLFNLLAKEQGFRVVLASIESHVEGTGDDDFGQNYGMISMGEVDEHHMVFAKVTDLDGQVVRIKIDGEKLEGETIPDELAYSIQEGQPFKEEYEGYQGNYAGSMEQWYRRTALIVWPETHSPEIEHGKEGCLEMIRRATPISPSDKERQVAEYLLRAAGSNRIPNEDVVHAVCHAASVWGDVDLWQRAIRVCAAHHSPSVLGIDGLLFSIKTLGFKNVQSTVEEMLMNDPSNTVRLTFLDDLEKRVAGQTNLQLTQWIADQRLAVFRSLKKPANTEISLLFRVAHEQGGVSYLETNILPHLKVVADAQFLVRFVRHLLHHKASLVSESNGMDELAMDRIVTDLTSTAVSKVEIFEPESPGTSRSKRHDPTKPTPSPIADIFRTLDVCFEIGNSELAQSLLSRALDEQLLSRNYIRQVLVPLLPQLTNICKHRQLMIYDEPFGSACKAIIMAWTDRVLGPRPADGATAGRHVATIKRHMVCQCTHCLQVTNFLANSLDRERSWPGIGAEARRHVERELDRFARSLAKWKAIPGTPQGLVVTKLDAIYGLPGWIATAAEGLKILQSVSADSRIMRRILGHDYDRVKGLLRDESRPDARAPVVSSSAPERTRNAGSGPAGTSAGSATGQPAIPSSYSVVRIRSRPAASQAQPQPQLKRKRPGA